MALPLISVCHPTARVVPSEAFPRGWRDAHDAFLAACDHPENVEYLLSVHESRWEEFMKSELYQDIGVLPWRLFNVVKNINRDCLVDQINTLCEYAEGRLLIGCQDDLFAPEHWDTLLLVAALPKDGWYGESIIICSSGASPERDRELMICQAVTRSRIERIGYGLDPDFESMFADNMYAWQARQDEKAGLTRIIERLDIKFDHRHPSMGHPEKLDEVYELQNRQQAYLEGAATFHQKVTGAKVIVICLPGEVFRNEWCASTFQMIQQLGQMGYITAPHWCYTSLVNCTRIELAQAALAFKPKADYVLWVDDDNIVNAQQVQMLIEDLETRPQLGGVTGWCWCDHNQTDGQLAQTWKMSVGRQTRPGLKCATFTPEDFKRAYTVDPVITSDDVAPDAFWSGFPCVLMRRSALEKLGWEAFIPVCRPDVKYKFMGEDASFFYNAHNAGVKFGVDIRVKVPHVKWRAIEPGVGDWAKQQQKAAEVPVEVLT